jgi:predicted RNA binding protein YcfA (HicA-like mRNA interferase family)
LKLPRDLSGQQFATLLRRYGYEVTRQTGSHLRLTSALTGTEHHITIPVQRNLRVGTLSDILLDIASQLGKGKDELAEELFG